MINKLYKKWKKIQKKVIMNQMKDQIKISKKKINKK